MASIKKIAKEVIEDARDGIAWIAIWKTGRSWNGCAYYPEDIDRNGVPTWGEEEMTELKEIAKTDKNAIVVNAYWHNLGSVEEMTVESLANALRWQYGDVSANLITDYAFMDEKQE